MSHERVAGFPQTGADLWEGPGNFRGNSGLLLKFTVGEVLGKSPRNFRGSSGKFWEVKLGGA